MAQPEALTEQDRERADLIANNPHLSLGDRRLVSKLVRLHDAQAEMLEAVTECERRYSLHVPWPVAEELRLALIKDCPHAKRFELAGGEWQCERCGAQGLTPSR
jgi:hypothetical protein